MTVSPQNLVAWINEHYHQVDSPFGPYLVCKRCRKRVGYVTKHAVVRHGDDVEVLPPVNLAMADAY